MKHSDVLIAGGGIAGQTLALALARRGGNATLIEERSLTETAGAGIQLSPNAAHVLIALGLDEDVGNAAMSSRAVRVRGHASGLVAYEFPLGAAAIERFGAPYWHCERGTLMKILAAAVRAEPTIEVRENTAVAEWIDTGDGLAARLANGESLTAALVVGADGIHSKLATRIANGSEPVFTGQCAWRATLPLAEIDDVFADDITGLWTGPGAHLVHYPLPGDKLNLIACVESNDWLDPDWRIAGTRSELKASFAGWHRDIQQLLDTIETPWRWALFDRPSLCRFSEKNAVVIGDAAHPMLPFAAQGAAQAIEDAWILAAALETHSELGGAIAAFESTRIERVRKVTEESTQRAKTYHQRSTRGKLKTLTQKWRAQNASAAWTDSGYDWLYGYNAPQEFPLQAAT